MSGSTAATTRSSASAAPVLSNAVTRNRRSPASATPSRRTTPLACSTGTLDASSTRSTSATAGPASSTASAGNEATVAMATPARPGQVPTTSNSSGSDSVTDAASVLLGSTMHR